jgi:hypothetical protein
MGNSAVVVENRSPNINQQIFADYISRVFLPSLRKARTTPLIVPQLALLLTNNWKAHMGCETQKGFADYSVMMMAFAPQTMNIFQVRYISLFGIFELIKGNVDESGLVYELTDQIVKIIRV